MSDSTLSQCVNIRKAIARNARYSGRLGVEQLPHYEDQLPATGMPLAVVVDFGEDDQGQQHVIVELTAEVVLECQRCLRPVSLTLRSKSRLGLVADDEQAQQLASDYEPLIAIEDVDLWQIAGEELALALPVVAYHPTGECRVPDGVTAPNEEAKGLSAAPVSGEQDNPFSVLSTLFDSGDPKEK